MRELVRTNDPVVLSAAVSILEAAGLRPLVLDENMSAMSFGVIQRRIMMVDDEFAQARRLLSDAGLAHELRPDGRV